MNPLTKVKLINELNEREADLGVNENVSWHTEYKDSAWIFIGGFPYELTEGDIICVFSQYGEIVNINLVRDKKTGKSKGFCFICYEDQRSTILAVDNFNGIKIKGRTLRVDHVKDYRPPKDTEDIDDVTKQLREDGCAPKAREHSSSSSDEDEQYAIPVKKPKKDKKEKKKKKKEKKEKKKAEKEKERGSRVQHSSSSSPPLPPPAVRIKEEKADAAYDKYNQRGAPPGGQQNGQRPRENERLRGEEERRREADREREEDRRRNREREGDRRRETDFERKRERETDRDNDRRRETDRDNDRRRETDRDNDRRRETDRDNDRRRETDRDNDRRRETDRERPRKH
ncbi:RNA-binding motif protein, X-linked 2 isoform X2 [Chaetodon trifascialis]|uniref:RNA-binding motif protein, X-linked 2 isoform X2 n=1 Tax=Chaetodon trifascialis TaxID=109706 RepID=UPI0039953841